jgi:hypothetical protein
MPLVRPQKVQKEHIFSLLKRVPFEARIKAAVFPSIGTIDIWAVEITYTYCRTGILLLTKGGIRCAAVGHRVVQPQCLKCSCQHKMRPNLLR